MLSLSASASCSPWDLMAVLTILTTLINVTTTTTTITTPAMY